MRKAQIKIIPTSSRLSDLRPKRAQTEMLGMAIVILLLSMGILIIVGNVLKSSSTPSIKQAYSEKQLATNILGSILSTTTNCNNEKISTLMIDCGRGWPVECGNQQVGSTTIYGNPNVCKYLNNTIFFMLNETLYKWGKKYSFLAYVRKDEKPNINITYRIDECIRGLYEEGQQYIQKEYYYLPLQAGSGSMTVELGICS